MNITTFTIISVLLFSVLMLNISHLFNTVLWLEVIVLFWVLTFTLWVNIKSGLTPTMILFMIAMVVTEASLALAALVVVSRNNSALSVKSLNIMKC